MKYIERKIIECLKKTNKKHWNIEGSARWTMIIKKALTRLGHQHGYEVWGAPRSRLKADWREWLYDLCWAKEDKCRSVRLGLVVEIEWNHNKGSILTDFQKLTVGVADYRLMVTYCSEKNRKSKQKHSDIVQICKKASPAKKGFRYLLAIMPKYDHDKMTVAHWVK